MRKIRWSAVYIGISNGFIIILGIVLMVMVDFSTCEGRHVAPFVLIVLASCVRIAAMIRTAMAQRAAALFVVDSQADDNVTVRCERRRRYKRMLRWTRFSTLVTVIQFLGAAYLVFNITHSMYHNKAPQNCVPIVGPFSSDTQKQHDLLVLFTLVVCSVALVQCFAGSEVLRWRAYYATEDNMWKAHYGEIFDHGIREALCCMGRGKYLTVLEEDEVYSVAQLLGDLVTYRASGTGHLELLAGLALLQKSIPTPELVEESSTIPEERLQEAVFLHPFAEAAYTGLLLDLGRNPIFSPFSWLYRQGFFTPWSRNRQPVLEGDNWWRGHARAFLKFVNLTPEMLRKGRVNQGKCKAAYFIVVLHDSKSVVIAVRGTETPEDLITDGLGRECDLTPEDLAGLISDNHIEAEAGMIKRLLSTSSSSSLHYGHSGIAEAARDLYTQVEGSENGGFLSKLLGPGCECDGYNVRIVGHSLGGAIAAFLGLRLRRQFPQLHVYAYGPLPCLDMEAADSCSDFITSIVYANEFSSRLSIASILRLRAAAIKALSEVSSSDTKTVENLASNFLNQNYSPQNQNKEISLAVQDLSSKTVTFKDSKHQMEIEMEDTFDEEANSPNSESGFTWNMECSSDLVRPCEESGVSASFSNIREMYLPGLIMHIVPEKNDELTPLWKRLRGFDIGSNFKARAYVANREAFKDIEVSLYMFLDHLPWRCYSAIKKVAEVLKSQGLKDESHMV